MKIGIVVPLEMLGEITEFVKKEFPDLTAVPFPYRSIPEIPKILSGQQNKADAFLFLGETARRFAESAVRPSAEWLAIPRSASALLRILFRASSAAWPCASSPTARGRIFPSRLSGDRHPAGTV